MYCNQCGKEINKEMRFCPFCGAEQKRRNAGKSNVSEEKETKEEAQGESQKRETTFDKSNEEQNSTKEPSKIETEKSSVKKEAEDTSEKKSNSQTKDTNKGEKNNSWDSWRSLFGPIYYFQEGLWKKGLLLLSVIFLASSILFNVFPRTSFLWIFLILYITVFEYMPRKDIEESIS
ncbi:zinc-ribbon domain-containing protein [Tetragenococcus koreensis]|uniref:zinc ribbon domain-containing protein n=1 Tax=Tetragenococcus koreensis TaxID=290335 RepID=UPI001F37B4BA|nr:zinc-ribbon domain-containing protein [Tetragenococcus koreensis]MCF1585809.1 zinc-ribbon domain-containing protein [Tetragenococcus koreensis]MCF1630057.1 zinc-ribbon domain-containing protein [Tetragenococcus koreensis]